MKEDIMFLSTTMTRKIIIISTSVTAATVIIVSLTEQYVFKKVELLYIQNRAEYRTHK